MITQFSEADIPEAAEAEKLCFSVPWSEESLKMLTKYPGYGLIYRDGDAFAAYGGMLCVADEAQILNVATLPDYRRRGYAREIIRALCDAAKQRNAVVVTLEVRESNMAARRLYTGEGFYEIWLRPGYYFNPREAAVIMEKKL